MLTHSKIQPFLRQGVWITLHDKYGLALKLLVPFESFAFEAYPGDAHLRHVLTGERPGFVRFEADHLRNLIAGVLPFRAGKRRARIVGAFGILHHLPEAFETCVFLSMEHKRRRREIRE